MPRKSDQREGGGTRGGAVVVVVLMPMASFSKFHPDGEEHQPANIPIFMVVWAWGVYGIVLRINLHRRRQHA